jgi:hypothetical protein
MDMQKFSSQADSGVLADLRRIATAEGRQFQSVLDEALRDFVAKKQGGRPRPHVMTAFGESLAQYDALYRKLAQ